MGVFMTTVMPFFMAKVMENLPANTQNGLRRCHRRP